MQEILSETFGMFVQVTNIILVIFLPVLIIHLKGEAFSLSNKKIFKIYKSKSLKIYLIPSWRFLCMFYLFSTISEAMELRSDEYVVSADILP